MCLCVSVNDLPVVCQTHTHVFSPTTSRWGHLPLRSVLVPPPAVMLGPAPWRVVGSAQGLWSFSETKALGGVSQVKGADVKDVFEVSGVCGVRPQEGLQC